MKRNILTNAFGYIRLLKGKASIKKIINIIPDLKFVHMKTAGVNFQKSYSKLIRIPTQRRFQRRTCNVGGSLPMPRHYRF
jgi:hypothetical protein